MSLLSFLKTSTVEEVSKAPATTKQKNPAPAIVAIRVWKNGEVYPSQAAVDKFDFEYRPAKITTEVVKAKEPGGKDTTKKSYDFPNGSGNGLDVIDSRAWTQFKSEGAMLFCAVVDKSAGKVDLFNTVAFEDDGKPKASVMTQGTNTFGKEVLVPAVEEIYKVKFNRSAIKDERDQIIRPAVEDGVDFVDLMIVEELEEGTEKFNITQNLSRDILFAPKRITRGADKGKADYARRENVRLYGLIPAVLAAPEANNVTVKAGEGKANNVMATA